jgi:hypothetical protein
MAVDSRRLGKAAEPFDVSAFAPTSYVLSVKLPKGAICGGGRGFVSISFQSFCLQWNPGLLE